MMPTARLAETAPAPASSAAASASMRASISGSVTAAVSTTSRPNAATEITPSRNNRPHRGIRSRAASARSINVSAAHRPIDSTIDNRAAT